MFIVFHNWGTYSTFGYHFHFLVFLKKTYLKIINVTKTCYKMKRKYMIINNYYKKFFIYNICANYAKKTKWYSIFGHFPLLISIIPIHGQLLTLEVNLTRAILE